MKNLLSGAALLASLVALLVGMSALRQAPVTVGAASGTFHSNLEQFMGDLTVGGNTVASSTSASVTLAGTEFKNASTLDYTVNVGSVTLTLPASTTAMCSSLATNESRLIAIRHATTTAASNLTIAGGTGFILKKVATSTGSTIYGDTDGASYAFIRITRKANTDCNAFLSVFND